MSDLTCPYCGYEQAVCHDDGFDYEEGERHEVECKKCEKLYHFVTSIRYYYESISVDCSNTEDHDYKQSRWYPNKVECSICGDVKAKTDDCQTTVDFWDCECEGDYQHKTSDKIHCSRCNSDRDESPDSRINEL
jgi:hypothetical protein